MFSVQLLARRIAPSICARTIQDAVSSGNQMTLIRDLLAIKFVSGLLMVHPSADCGPERVYLAIEELAPD